MHKNSKQTADSDSFLFHTTLHCMVVTKIRTLVYITTNQSIQKKNVKKENWIVLVTRQIQMIILDSSRLENLHWCTCKKFVIGVTMTLDECKCFRECKYLPEKTHLSNLIYLLFLYLLLFAINYSRGLTSAIHCTIIFL